MYALYSLIHRLIYLYETLIFVWAILSWVPRSESSPLARFEDWLSRIVEPYVGIFSNLLPPFSGIDFSPVVAIFVLVMIDRILGSIMLF